MKIIERKIYRTKPGLNPNSLYYTSTPQTRDVGKRRDGSRRLHRIPTGMEVWDFIRTLLNKVKTLSRLTLSNLTHFHLHRLSDRQYKIHLQESLVKMSQLYSIDVLINDSAS